MMFLLPVGLFSSSFYLIRHVPSFSLVGPWILLRTFLSNTLSLVFMFSFSTHVSQAYVTFQVLYFNKKGKAIPLQARCGPESGYRYSSTLT